MYIHDDFNGLLFGHKHRKTRLHDGVLAGKREGKYPACLKENGSGVLPLFTVLLGNVVFFSLRLFTFVTYVVIFRIKHALIVQFRVISFLQI